LEVTKKSLKYLIKIIKDKTLKTFTFGADYVGDAS